MAFSEEIARLTGTLVWQADTTQLTAFEKKLGAVRALLTDFSTFANKTFKIQVKLDHAVLKESLDKAAKSKITFSNFSMDSTALEGVQLKIKEKLDITSIRLNNVKIDIASLTEQKRFIRAWIGMVKMDIPVSLKMTSANKTLREWKASTEKRFALHLNADISRSKLYRNASKTLKMVGDRLGTFTLKTPKIRLSVDREHLRAEIASVLEQIKREVKIDINLNSRVTGRGNGSTGASGTTARRGKHSSALDSIMPLALGLAIPGLGFAHAMHFLNERNQEMQGQMHGMMAVTAQPDGTNRGAEMQTHLTNMAQQVGFNARELAPTFIKTVASGMETGFTQSQSEGIFKGVIEYSRVMGLSTKDMKLALMSIEKMMNMGTIQSAELKKQLGTHLPAAVPLMAEALHVGIPELMKMMKKGQVSSEKLLEFAHLLAEKARAGGALEAGENGSHANMMRLQNSEDKSIRTFSDGGGFDLATNGLFKVMSAALEKNQPLFASLGKTFELLIRPLNALVVLLGDLGEKWPDIAKGLGMTTDQLTALTAVVGIALLPFGGLLIAISLVALALEDLVAYLSGADSALGRFLKTLSPENQQDFVDTGTMFKDTATDIVQAGADIKKALRELSPSFKEFDDSLSKDNIFHFIMERIRALLASIQGLAKAASALSKGNFSEAADHIDDAAIASTGWYLPSALAASVADGVSAGDQAHPGRSSLGDMMNRNHERYTELVDTPYIHQALLRPMNSLPGINTPLGTPLPGAVGTGSPFDGSGSSVKVDTIMINIDAGQHTPDSLGDAVARALHNAFDITNTATGTKAQ
jgi:tape measure domain-containing protein